jgi:hypothetical protein
VGKKGTNVTSTTFKTKKGHNNMVSHQEDHTWAKTWDKVAKAFVGEEIDDQGHLNMNRTINING